MENKFFLIHAGLFLFFGSSGLVMAGPGDVASPPDGRIKPTDALAAFQMSLGQLPKDMDADVAPLGNPNGKIESDDALTILRHYLKKVSITKSSKSTSNIKVDNNSAPEAFTEDASPFTLTSMVITGTTSPTVTATLVLNTTGAGTLSTGSSGAVTSTFNGTVWRASGALADVNTLLSGVTFTPEKNFDQNFIIATSVSDGIAPPVNEIKNVTVTAINDLPTISSITNQTTAANTATNAIAFTVGDVETAAASLTVTGSSSNKTLVPDANIVFGGSGGSRTLTVTPASGQSGSATITIEVNDGKATATTSFAVTVSAPVATTTSSVQPTTSVTTTTTVKPTTTVIPTTTITATTTVSTTAKSCTIGFCDNGNGTITDSKTGLIGLKNADCFGPQNWDEALSKVAALKSGDCGLTDGSTAGQWRLLTKDELQIYIDWKNSGVFVDAQSIFYWSSTAIDPFNAYDIGIYTGTIYESSKSYKDSVWPVRGGQ
ncbi:MAG: DUF1566 domain-containing protein [Magnetococcus sp. YQC-5]